MNTIELFSAMLQEGKEVFLSAEDLLTMFNRNNSKNAELLDYIGKKNLFEIIGKTRNEGVHSRFITELLSGEFFNGQSRESTLFHFLDLLLYRSAIENKTTEINEHLKKKILTRSVLIEKVKPVCELYVKDYQKMYGVNNTNSIESDDRIDIYLRYKLIKPIAGLDTLEIFIENKILSPEEGPKSGKNMKLTGYDDQWQTQRYYQATSGNGNNLKLYVYLRPDKLSPVSKSACNCKQYIQICYQDLLDYILIPLTQNDDLAERSKILVQEYIDSLSIPTTDTSAHKRIVMASTQDEMKWINLFIERNKQLMFLMLKAMCSKKNSKLLSADEELLLDFAEYNKNLIYAIANMIEDKSVNLDDLYDYSKPVSGYLIEPLFAIFKDSSFGFEFAKRFAIHNESKVNSINDLNKLLSTEISLVTTGIYYNSSTIQLQCRKIDDFKKFDLYATTGTWQKGDKGLLTRLMNALNKNPLSYFSWTVI